METMLLLQVLFSTFIFFLFSMQEKKEMRERSCVVQVGGTTQQNCFMIKYEQFWLLSRQKFLISKLDGQNLIEFDGYKKLKFLFSL